MRINHKYYVPFEPVIDFKFTKYNELVDCTPYEQHIIPDIPRVISLLMHDRNTRQAIIIVSEGIGTKTNMNSCLISIQWQVVDRTLVCTANYRSQCSVNGRPHDELMIKYLTTIIKDEFQIDDVLIECNVANYHKRTDILTNTTEL